jgi:transcriptional regulator with XRE-family HTH domain
MNQTARLLETLKHYLKIQGMTYRNLAQRLKLSESSVKRLFSDQSLSLKRLEKICSVLGLDFYELVKLSREQKPLAAKFNDVQQKALLSQPGLLVLLVLFVNGWTAEELRLEFGLQEVELPLQLRQLEQLKLIEWLPQDRIRLCFERNVLWKKSSPLWQIWGRTNLIEFLNDEFDETKERWHFAAPQLSSDSRKLILNELDRLMQTLEELQDADAALPADEREPTGFLLAHRAWVPSLLDSFQSQSKDCSSEKRTITKL